MIFENAFIKVVSVMCTLTSVGCSIDEKPSASIAQIKNIECSLDHRIDPCVDFYAFACNNWEEQHKNKSYKEITGEVEKKINLQMMNIITTLDQQPHRVFEKARIYFKACIKERQNNVKRYFESVKPSDTLEWPLLEHLWTYKHYGQNIYPDEWPREEWNAFAMLGDLQSYGLNNVLINHEIARYKNNSLKIVLELPYMNEQDQLVPEMLMFLLQGLGLPEEISNEYVPKLMETQEMWHKIYENFSTQNIPENVKSLSYSELCQQYPKLSKFLEKLFATSPLQADDEIVVTNFEYFDFLEQHQWAPEEQRNLCNYLMINFAIYLLKDSTNEFTHLDCIIDLRNKMDLALNFLYYENIYLKKGTKISDELVLMFQDLKMYFFELFQENPLYLNEGELQQLMEKLKFLRTNIGNLPMNVNRSQIEEFYKGVPELQRDNYYYNHLQLLKHRFQKSLVYMQNETFFIATDNSVGSSSGPYYSPRQNMAVVNLGFLQTPIYEYSYHPILKWSMIGFLMGHEFAHSIDPAGLMFDPQGQWSPESNTIIQNPNFISALDCMQKQEATDAINERIADLVGTRVAYKAYVRLYQSNVQPINTLTRIPWKQLFFLNMAQYFCGRKETTFLDHDKDAVRLREIVKNTEAFSEAFHCRQGTPMNPWPKCRLY